MKKENEFKAELQEISANFAGVETNAALIAKNFSELVESNKVTMDLDSGVLEIEIHFTIEEAKTALQNSGVVEMFGFEQLEEVAKWMYKHDASAESAAKYFKVI